jgi:hypothetical protein
MTLVSEPIFELGTSHIRRSSVPPKWDKRNHKKYISKYEYSTLVYHIMMRHQIHRTGTKEVSQLSLYLFIYGSFNNVVSIFDYTASNDTMISDNELEGMWKEAIMANLRYYLSICLKGLRKSQNSCQCNWYLSSDSNRTHSQYKPEVLTLEPTYLVVISFKKSCPPLG